MPPWRRVGAGFPIWLPREGAGPVPYGAASSPRPAPLAAPRHPARSLVRAQCWLCQGRRPQAQQPNEARERTFGLGQQKPGELWCGAEPSRVRKPRTCRSRCWPRTRCAPNSSVAVSGHPAPARCTEEARGAGMLWGETEARGKLRHGEAAAAEPAGVSPSGALRAGPCCLPFPGEVSFPLQAVAVCSEVRVGFPPCCSAQP